LKVLLFQSAKLRSRILVTITCDRSLAAWHV